MLDEALVVSSPRVRLKVYWILHIVAENEPISFRICLVATYVQIDISNMPRFERILCHVLLSFFLSTNFWLNQVNTDHHRPMDLRLAETTLYLEDIIVRTLLYERSLKKWRIEELEAGRPDPGRSSYNTVGWLFNFFLCLNSITLGIWWHGYYTASVSRRRGVLALSEV